MGALAMAGLLLLAGGEGSVAQGADPPKLSTPRAGGETPPQGKRPALAPARKAQFAALALWCVILFVGLALIVMVMIWGRHLRRNVSRRSAPFSSTAPDPLWYLKKKPTAVGRVEHSQPPDEGKIDAPPPPDGPPP